MGEVATGLFGGGDSDDESALPKADSTAMGSVVCNIEGEGDLNHFMVCGDSLDPKASKSGLVMCAGEQSRIQAYYSPDLGTAPRWCSFLDNITEELEERGINDELTSSAAAESVYDDYKFLSREEVTKLGIDNLIGTPLLRGYMHGFFIDSALYSKVRSVANPFEYEEYRKKKVREKVEAKAASRITPKAKVAKGKGVNKELADRLEAKSGSKASKDKKVRGARAPTRASEASGAKPAPTTSLRTRANPAPKRCLRAAVLLRGERVTWRVVGGRPPDPPRHPARSHGPSTCLRPARSLRESHME
jgi:hypothetical protein